MKKRIVKPEHERREEIINAAFAVIYEVGLSNTTIAQIAKKAQVSTGIVSHYFGDKQGLMTTCMREMLKRLYQITQQYKSEVNDPQPEHYIKAIVNANFDLSQVNKTAMRVWLDFWSASMHTPELARLQRVNDRRLYSNLKYQFLKLLPEHQADIAASGLAALIDGLWLRGGLNQHDQFDQQAVRHIAYDYLEIQFQRAKLK
ncbi:transcriptional regulator BetI [Acinetobacter qingfengensis]|uniref:HTH-type transcriptional regulator BetI n=1 Tax=Acinetobacter qingfengensis TaxID=1262585 RepID=A0A1E7R1G1_9GAMM|nr:transcriptional regulator BetI [Acinetobacter qingfengensis]KAA8733229.1 transcriptional regulator BetI [Acinetobacter qingfengensis]OEY93138.1 transcriptional regulator BetI [Acinetobacter qingfengensis]